MRGATVKANQTLQEIRQNTSFRAAECLISQHTFQITLKHCKVLQFQLICVQTSTNAYKYVNFQLICVQTSTNAYEYDNFS